MRSKILLLCFTLVFSACGDKRTKEKLLILDNSTAETLEVDPSLTVFLVGDIMLGTTYPKSKLPIEDGKEIFRESAHIMKNCDIGCGNLEGVFIEKGKSRKEGIKNSYSFSMPPRYIDYLAQNNFTFLSLANNHSNDFGRRGLDSTITYLNNKGIKYAGLRGTFHYALTNIKGQTIGFCAFGFNRHNICLWEEHKVKEIIKSVKEKSNITIVSFHAGAEGLKHKHLPFQTESYLGENRGFSRRFAELCVDAGADIIFGHGPHIPRAVNLYKGKFIAYSLGNFATPRGMSIEKEMGLAPLIVVTIDRNGNFLNGQIHSFKQQYAIGPRKDEENAAAKEIKSLSEDDFSTSQLNITDDGIITINNK